MNINLICILVTFIILKLPTYYLKLCLSIVKVKNMTAVTAAGTRHSINGQLKTYVFCVNNLFMHILITVL